MTSVDEFNWTRTSSDSDSDDEDEDDDHASSLPPLHRSSSVSNNRLAIALDAANNSAILSRSSYRAGLADFLTLSQAEASLISARNGLNQARSDKANALIQLYLALGGGWDAATAPTPDTVTAPPPVSGTGTD